MLTHEKMMMVFAGLAMTTYALDKCYIGCYRDNRDRDFEKRVVGRFNVGTCRAKCAELNYNYFSVQYGNECFCGNAYATKPVYKLLDDSKCIRKGYPAGQGGAWANSVYEVACNNAADLVDCGNRAYVASTGRHCKTAAHLNGGGVLDTKEKCERYMKFKPGAIAYEYMVLTRGGKATPHCYIHFANAGTGCPSDVTWYQNYANRHSELNIGGNGGCDDEEKKIENKAVSAKYKRPQVGCVERFAKKADIKAGQFVHIPGTGAPTTGSDSECKMLCQNTFGCQYYVRQPSTGKCWRGHKLDAQQTEYEADRNVGFLCPFEFTLRGDTGEEIVEFEGKSYFLDKKPTVFRSANAQALVKFVNDRSVNGFDRNVRMATNYEFYDVKAAGSLWPSWKCGSSEENERCDWVRDGIFAWNQAYSIEFLRRGAKLCEHDKLKGLCCELGPGTFQKASKQCPLGNDKLSSVQVTEGCRVTLQQHFSNHNNGGQKWNLKGPGYFSHYKGDFRNDDVSSFVIDCSETPEPTPNPTPAPTTFLETRFGMCYIGCYKDDAERDMEKRVSGSFNVMQCRVQCSKLNYKYFSVQWGNQCFCGNDYATKGQYQRLDDSKCRRNGFPAGQGGSWANSVYKTECDDSCSVFNGIPHQDGLSCCKASCGKFCGASNCNQGPGGPSVWSPVPSRTLLGIGSSSVIPDNHICTVGNKMAPCTLKNRQGAKLCEHDNLKGVCCEVGPGEFRMPSKQCSIPNDKLSSVKVTEDCRVQLNQHYANHNNGGQKWNLEGPGYFSYRKDFRNDDVSSFVVECGEPAASM